MRTAHFSQPNGQIYPDVQQPLPDFSRLNISSDPPDAYAHGPSPVRPLDIPLLYMGYTLTRKKNAGEELSWRDVNITPMVETQETLKERVTKEKRKSVPYTHSDMDGSKRTQLDRVIKALNFSNPGYEYKLALLKLEEGRSPKNARICKKMDIILKREATTVKVRLPSWDPDQSARNPHPIYHAEQEPYAGQQFGHQDTIPRGDTRRHATHNRPLDQQNRSHPPTNLQMHPDVPPIPPSPPFPYQDQQEQFIPPQARPGEFQRIPPPNSDRRDQHVVDVPAQHHHRAQQRLENPGLHPDRPLQGLQVPADGRAHQRGGAEQRSDGHEQFHSRPCGGNLQQSEVHEQLHPRPLGGVEQRFDGHEQSHPGPRGGNLQQFEVHEQFHPRPLGGQEQHSDRREQFHPRMRGETEQHPERHEQFYPRQRSGEHDSDENEQFHHRLRWGHEEPFDRREEFQPHPPAGQDRKPRNTSREARTGRSKETGNSEGQAHRDSYFFDSGYSSDEVRSDYAAKKNRNKGYTEVSGRKYHRGQRENPYPGKDQKDDRRSRRGMERDSDPGNKSKHRDRRGSSLEDRDRGLHHRNSLQSLDSNLDHFESDSDNRTTLQHKHRRNGSRYSSNKDYREILSSNGYLEPEYCSEDDSSKTLYNRSASLRTRAAGRQKRSIRGANRHNYPVHVHDLRDELDILAEHEHERRRKEMEKKKFERLNADRSREEIIRGERDRTTGRVSAHAGRIPRPRFNGVGGR